MKEFCLYKFMGVTSIVIFVIAIIGTFDFSEAAPLQELMNSLGKPLDLKNWHYAVLVLLLWGNKS